MQNNEILNGTYDEERAFYGSKDLVVKNCKFDGPADGESAFKECSNIRVEDSYFNLRYPFWHVDGLSVQNSEMTDLCRAALWYTKDVEFQNVKMHGIKALRECENVRLTDCDIISPEFGWSSKDVYLLNCSAESEYFFMRGANLTLKDTKFKGKYSFQYVENAVIDHCDFDTKDAFWHSKNMTVTDSVVKGEYLAWYSEYLTLIRCKIIGTQPFCYCKNLRLIDCEMIDTDLAFEKSTVDAVVTTPILSVKNPRSGKILCPSVGELIMDDELAEGEVVFTNH